MQDKPFEVVVSKLLNELECEMNDNKQNAVNLLMLDQVEIYDHCSDDFLYFEQIQSKQRKLPSALPLCIDGQFVPAITCLVERFFSAARWILTVSRKSMSPILFEELLISNVNCWLCDIKMVSSRMKLSPRERYMELDNDLSYAISNK